MRFFDSIAHSLRQGAEFSGRASRSEFWSFLFFAVLAQFLARLLDAVFLRPSPFGGPIAGLLSLLLLVPQIAVAVRRLHDVNRGGRELVIPGVLLLAAPLLIGFGRGFLPKIVALGVAGLTVLLFANLLLLLARRGASVPNRYGASPTAFSYAR